MLIATAPVPTAGLLASLAAWFWVDPAKVGHTAFLLLAHPPARRKGGSPESIEGHMRGLASALPGICRTLGATHRRLSEHRRPPTPPAYARRPLPSHHHDRLRPIDGHAYFLRPYVQPYAPVVHRG